MSIKRFTALCLSVLICFAAAGCGKKEPDPANLQTPQYSIQDPAMFELPPDEEIHTSDMGVKVIETVTARVTMPDSMTPAAAAPITPETVWANDTVVSWNAFTMPEMAAFDNGSIGVLSIPKIGLTVRVYESDDAMEDMARGAAHFKSTSSWDGNIGLSSHNRTPDGQAAYFRDLHTLSIGDTLIYRTALGEREYRVTASKTISDEDWSWLSRTADNRLTLITCVDNNLSRRLVVQGVQV